MRFEWDENKNQINIKKHGVSFEEASTIFISEVLEIPDKDHSEKEERFIAFGISSFCRELFVCYCYREHINGNEVIRIISARKASKEERKEFFHEG